MKSFILGLAAVISLDLAAQAQPADFIQHYQALPNAGTLFLKFCPFGISAFCTERRAIAYGQVCNPRLAHGIGTGESGDVMGGLPTWPMRYAGWRCESATKASELPSGDAGLAVPPPLLSLPSEPFHSGKQGGECEDDMEKGCVVWVNKQGVHLGYCLFGHADGPCSSWYLTAAGVEETHRRSAALPECPADMSFRDLLGQSSSCKISENKLKTKQIGGFAD